MHDDISRFSMDGVIGDEADGPSNREELIVWLEGDMRDQGFVPVLDIDPQYTQTFDAKTEFFHFVLTMYGVFVGKEDAWQISGVMSGKTIRTFTRHPKSKES